jgi:hypothetical protein
MNHHWIVTIRQMIPITRRAYYVEAPMFCPTNVDVESQLLIPSTEREAASLKHLIASIFRF